MLDAYLQRVWYGGDARWLSWLLLPLSGVFGAAAALRRAAYRSGVFRTHRVARPVVVVGNLTVGGVGKTPFTIWLANRLAARGVRVGVVLRGYGGRSRAWPRDVTSATSVEEVGDEAVLIATRTPALVVAGPDRVADAQRAIERGAEIVLADDGLQHYRLARDREIAVIDAQRGLGNQRLLPAGPLREPARRLRGADLIVHTRRGEAPAPISAEPTRSVVAVASLADAHSLYDGQIRPLASFAGQHVHAVAAIGNPQAFFEALAAAGLFVDGRPLPDHANLTPTNVSFDDEAPVLMTEKDAVKCRAFADKRRLWAVRQELELDAAAGALVDAVVEPLLAARR
jgi:tetraacyldisaccharide 4'-kinase